MLEAVNYLLVPLGLGLLGFVEPCSVGTHLLFLKSLENRNATAQVTAAVIFTLIRTLVAGGLGLIAVLIGSAFTSLQQGFWVVLGMVYTGIGFLYLTDKISILKVHFGRSISRLSSNNGTIVLGMLFGLNMPACAAPLLFVLFTTAVGADNLLQGFATLALFGFALSVPLLLFVTLSTFRNHLDILVSLSGKMPKLTGSLMLTLGMWSIGFGLFVELEKWV